MSPFCPGLTLEECPSNQSAMLRDQIKERVARGSTNRQIDEWLVAEYGESVLARPKGAVPWLVPAVLLAGGAGGLLYALSRRKAPPTEHPPVSVSSSSAPTAAERSRLAEDLGRFAEGTE